jgi:hypothetical protein
MRLFFLYLQQGEAKQDLPLSVIISVTLLPLSCRTVHMGNKSAPKEYLVLFRILQSSGTKLYSLLLSFCGTQVSVVLVPLK